MLFYICFSVAIFLKFQHLRKSAQEQTVYLYSSDSLIIRTHLFHFTDRSRAPFTLLLSVSFFILHTFPFASCTPTPFSFSHAQAHRKCQARPGYFRPNWEIDVLPETWHLDMPFILPRALPPKWQEPDMLTAD